MENLKNKGDLPVLTITVIACVSILSPDLHVITAAATALALYLSYKRGVKKFDFAVTATLIVVFFLLTHSLTLSLLFPLVATTFRNKLKSLSGVDYAVASIILIALNALKTFGNLDDLVYLDRNHIGLICALVLIIGNNFNGVILKTIRLLIFFSALTLLSRTFMLFCAIYLLFLILRNANYFKKSVSTWYPLIILISGTALSIVISLNINIDSFDSEVKNEYLRISEVNDLSNKYRVLALINYADYLGGHFWLSLLPTDMEAYKNITLFETTPHNTLLAITFNYGIALAVVYLIYIGWIMKKSNIKRSYFLMFAPYYFILGGVLFGPALVLFFIASRSEQ